MKKILFIMTAVAALMSASCSPEILNTESNTSISSSYLSTSKEGLEMAVVGLYALDRYVYTHNYNYTYIITMCDYCTDLMIFRGGTAAGAARLDSQTAATDWIERYWTDAYAVIGKANEIIAAAEKIGLDDPDVMKAYAEAKCLRAKTFFGLWIKYDRLYLNTIPTTLDNAFNRTFTAATAEETLALVKSDLQVAIDNLDWTCGTQYGRMTKAVAKHIRAQVAMWEKDWATAIRECEDIFACPDYSLVAVDKVFEGADLRNSEIIYAYQISANTGGGNTVSNGVVSGQFVTRDTTPQYPMCDGLDYCVEYGGGGVGRIFPNTYLIGLYDKVADKRYSTWFRHQFTYNNAAILPAGKALGDVVVPATGAQYLQALHPSTLKFFDKWTYGNEPNRTNSFKDLVFYRLAEDYLMCAEAYFRKDGGSSAKALEYYNKTWERAGNAAFAGPLTQDILVDEYARELHFEGVRFPLLKRLGLLEERVKAHYGNSKAEDPNLAKDYIEARKNFKAGRDECWPIPQSALQLMPGFGQNSGWE